MRLLSDFRDYYDHEFYQGTLALKRRMTDGPTRAQSFELFKENFFFGVPHWIVEDCPLDDDAEVVLYFGEGHAGVGKIKTTKWEAYVAAPGAIVSEYFPESFGCSERLLSVGKWKIRLEYKGEHWRSNVGDVEITVLGEPWIGEYPCDRHYPLWAVDFIQTNNLRYAVDFNVSPGIKWTPVVDLLKPRDVHELICEAVRGDSRTVMLMPHDARVTPCPR